ncbi:MAG: TIGR00159 family protein, partial [Streptococcus sp.]|nr:TIGR00159 family protein [Streptococcus sp.]
SVTYNGTFRHDLTLEEFEAELRAFLVPEENKTTSWKERLFGRVTK